MLRADRSDQERFDGNDLANLLESDGLEAVLPNALQDTQLLSVAEQLRTLLSGEDRGSEQGQGSAGLVLTLVLLSKSLPEASTRDPAVDIELSMVHEAMALVSFAVDREIVNRVLNQPDGQSGIALVSAIEQLTGRRNSRPTKKRHAT